MRIAIIALLISFVAGALAALTLKGMLFLEETLWHNSIAGSPFYIVVTCTIGGVLVGITRIGSNRVESLSTQIEAASNPLTIKRRQVLLIGLGAILAVGFGGSLGPEAGLIAVVTELAALVSLIVARSRIEAETLGQASVAGALAGFFGSPPGGFAFAMPEDGDKTIEAYRSDGGRILGFLPAVIGFGGFLWCWRLLSSEPFHRVEIPDYANRFDGSDLLFALVPAMIGAGFGAAFLFARVWTTRQFEDRIDNPVAQSALGGLAFGCLAAAVPMVMFSGHHQMHDLLEFGAGASALTLLGLALLKVLATTICLSSGWRGGAIFPLIFAGMAAGYAAQAFLPAQELPVALTAGIAACATVGLGKPIAALLILVFLIGTGTLGPLCVGVAIGMLASRYCPRPAH
ncbi:chloride channel protein [Aliiruegeria lutimaris]|uniref:H+/Cl-antiporter ClcA n=1 Tax=Aliiruegeria lutimaris TaxID=571298 RepID=A0A1G8XY05_9RHOB|nr:chloride channel protein [Aliiruegeria lutimaris]SDJ95396.1 H+/Cl-antiporter ClcA [Aliiruegeria lutimaris]